MNVLKSIVLMMHRCLRIFIRWKIQSLLIDDSRRLVGMSRDHIRFEGILGALETCLREWGMVGLVVHLHVN